jgi:hypothetical protein
MRTIEAAFTRLADAQDRAAHARVVVSDKAANLFPENVRNGTEAASITGFTAVASGSIATTTAAAWQGSRSLEITNTAAADGAKTDTIPVDASTVYSASLWLQAGAGDGGTLMDVYLRDETNATNGTTVQVRLREDRWTRVGCKHTMGAGSILTSLYVLSNTNAASVVYADGFQLQRENWPHWPWKDKDTEWTVSLEAYLGENWVQSVSWEESVDSQIATAKITLRREIGSLSLMPGVTGKANRDDTGAAADVLREGKSIEVFVQLGPAGSTPDPTGTWTSVLDGAIDDLDCGSDDSATITLSCRDLLGQMWQDTWIEDERPLPGSFGLETTASKDRGTDWYDDISWPATVVASTGLGLAADIIDGGMGPGLSPAIVRVGTQSWAMNQPRTENPVVTPGPIAANVVDRLAQPIGDDLRLRWYDTDSEWRPTWRVTTRSTVGITQTFARDFYRIQGWRRSIRDVRNLVEVVYSDSDNGWERKVSQAEDATSQSLYGLRSARRTEGSNSNINTTGEAETLRDIMLDEMSEPKWQATIRVPLFPWLELHDVVALSPPSRHFDASADTRGSVLTIGHTLGGGKATTTIGLREVDVDATNAPHWSAPATRFPAQRGVLAGLPSKAGLTLGHPNVRPPPAFTSTTRASRCRVYQSAPQVVAASAFLTLDWDALDIDAGGNFDLANDDFIAPVTGTYRFGVTVLMSAIVTGKTLQVSVLNGAVEVGGGEIVTQKTGAALSCDGTVWLVAGQKLSAKVFHSDSVARSTTSGIGGTTFFVERVAR